MDSSPVNNTNYSYLVSAVNHKGDSQLSEEISIIYSFTRTDALTNTNITYEITKSVTQTITITEQSTESASEGIVKGLTVLLTIIAFGLIHLRRKRK